MKYIREASDIHLDWDISTYHKGLYDPIILQKTCDMDMLWFPPPMDGDDETTFIVAGDIWSDGRFASRTWPNSKETWISKLSKQFKYVILVLGNHDYWGRNLQFEPTNIKDSLVEQGLTNTFLLEQDVVVLDQVKFVGGTLWTDYNKHDPISMYEAPRYMHDYRYTKFGTTYRPMRPEDCFKIHTSTKKLIFKNTVRDSEDQKVIVVTHMAPSFESVSEYHRDPSRNYTNHFYASELSHRIVDSDIDYWFHGHMHHCTRYEIGKTEVILNPRGYTNESTEFDNKLRIEL